MSLVLQICMIFHECSSKIDYARQDYMKENTFRNIYEGLMFKKLLTDEILGFLLGCVQNFVMLLVQNAMGKLVHCFFLLQIITIQM